MLPDEQAGSACTGSVARAESKIYPPEKSSFSFDARCKRPPGFPGDTDFTIYSYQLPVVIFDDRTGQILAWGYGDACVKPVPLEGSPGGYKRTGNTLTGLVLDLDRNVTAGPLPGCTEPPAARPWAAGRV